MRRCKKRFKLFTSACSGLRCYCDNTMRDARVAATIRLVPVMGTCWVGHEPGWRSLHALHGELSRLAQRFSWRFVATQFVSDHDTCHASLQGRSLSGFVASGDIPAVIATACAWGCWLWVGDVSRLHWPVQQPKLTHCPVMLERVLPGVSFHRFLLIQCDLARVIDKTTSLRHKNRRRFVIAKLSRIPSVWLWFAG